MSLDAFLKRSMHTAIERVPVLTKFLRQRFFGRVFTFGTAHIDLDLVMPKRGMAPFVHPTMPGKATAAQGFTMKTYTPPTLKPTKIITPEHLSARKPGATIYDTGTDQPELLAALLGERVAENNDEIAFRCEWMAGKALFTGAIPVVGDGYNHTISFDLPETHNLTLEGDARWGQSAAAPWDDLQGACRKNRDDGQVVSDTAVFGSGAWSEFRKWLAADDNEKYLDMLDMKLGMISPVAVDKYTTYCGTIRDADMVLDLFTYSAQYLDDDGSMKPYVPTDEVFIGSTQATGNQELYGAIQNLYAPSFRGQVYHDYELKKNPPAIEIVSQSAPLVTLLEPLAGTRIKVK